MKRFYKTAEVAQAEGGYTVVLDGRSIKTPAKAALILPTEAAAKLVAEEWNNQGDTVDPSAMVHARFANTAIDRIETRRTEVIEDIAAYAGSDLVCYRAERPIALVKKQAEAWDPVVETLKQQDGVILRITSGIMHVTQSPETLAALRAPLEAMTDHQLSAFFTLTTGLGSLVLALSLVRGAFPFDAVFQASQLDALYQEEEWGHDKEAADARAALKSDLEKAWTYFQTVTPN